jgi:predicted RNA polymerase sigma factor
MSVPISDHEKNETVRAGRNVAVLAAENVARHSYGKLIAFLAARTRDVAAAEDALSEAFASALAVWPEKGCPQNPEGWLLTVARRKMIDAARRGRTSDNASDVLRLLAEELDAALSQPNLPDHRLALLFACAHPAIDSNVRAALMLQVVLGLDAHAIASAFLVSPAAMAKKLSRAKEKIAQARIPFELPTREDLPERLSTVLDAIYAAFTEGWADGLGTNSARQALREESLYLAKLVTQLLPDEPEALGLSALMLHAAARQRARRSPEGEFVPLAEQDTSLWDKALIDEAEGVLRHARDLGAIGRYQLEAALQSAHAHRCLTGVRNWPAVVQLYDALLEISQSPVVAINRALAVAECDGPAVALEGLKQIEGDARLASYEPYWAARADLLVRLGRKVEARGAYEMAIGLEKDPAVRRFLQRRQLAIG